MTLKYLNNSWKCDLKTNLTELIIIKTLLNILFIMHSRFARSKYILFSIFNNNI